MSDSHPDFELDQARDAIREAGLRVTRPRLVAYALLREIGGHRSVDEMVGLLAERGESLSRMSAYNVVGDLTRAGLLMCAEIGHGRALYEASETWHHHFVCRECQEVFDVRCVVAAKPCIEAPTDLPGTVDEAQITFRGICNACAEAKPRSEESN